MSPTSKTTYSEDREIWERLAAARHGADPPREFEAWAIANSDLERVVGADLHLAIISFDYRVRDAWHELGRLIDAAYAAKRPGGFERDLASWAARALVDSRITLRQACGIMARLWVDDQEWVPTEFVYIDSELDEMLLPSQYHRLEPAALAARLAEEKPRREEFHRAALERARELLRVE